MALPTICIIYFILELNYFQLYIQHYNCSAHGIVCVKVKMHRECNQLHIAVTVHEFALHVGRKTMITKSGRDEEFITLNAATFLLIYTERK